MAAFLGRRAFGLRGQGQHGGHGVDACDDDDTGHDYNDDDQLVDDHHDVTAANAASADDHDHSAHAKRRDTGVLWQPAECAVRVGNGPVQ